MHSISQLPINQYRGQILKAIQNNRVIVISGKTGCGKSTQVPKYILDEYKDAKIAVCQPRRLAATSLAQRVAHQLKSSSGDIVGYQIGMQSKISDKTKIVYMTYGILIQQLLFHNSLQYTHILLDQVHERSLQMDFTFIALKKILDNQPKKDTKVIIMSATINSTQFAKHFSTHIRTKQFLKPTITYKQQRPQRRRGGRGYRNRDGLQQQDQSLPEVQIFFDYENYKQAQSIILPDKRLYKITEYFADQIKNNVLVPQYFVNQDVRVRDDAYSLAIRLIDQHLSKKQGCGDILIFVPGMFQIKFLKDKLIESLKIDPIQIIQVHSAYSQQLYRRLFVEKINNKIIIATNIGESSITLPFCKTVIDFCLTRKNITIKIKGYSRFQTRVASKANLLQRAGRVGRISDGTVYRLIPRQLYDKLDQFDIPQIQCVSLDMVILRAKQIDKTYKSKLFQDPYQVFFNAIQPPKYYQIHSAIEYLLKQYALVDIQNTSKPKISNKYIGQNLKITQTGQFMVTMPCNIRISKMILKSLKLGISSIIVDIAAILLTQKQFFQHQEKRYNIQEFMHSIVGYDRGNYNDFLLRQRLFSHWRSLFFQPLKKKRQERNKQKNNEKVDKRPNQMQKILQQFNNSQITKTQWQFCNDRGVSPWVMRDILRISQNIIQRLYESQFKINIERNTKKDKEQIDNQLVILCLCIAFEDTTCQIQWKLKGNSNFTAAYLSNKNNNGGGYKNQVFNYVSVIQSDKITEQDIYDFMAPEKQFKLTYESGGFIKIRGSCQTMSKLLLPRHYTKADIKNTSKFFRYLASNPPKVSYTYQSATVRERIRQVTILNDSINKVNIRPSHYQNYMLITDKIFDSKGKYYMGAGALVQRKTLILIKMMTAKQVLLEPHVSLQFYCKVIINEQPLQLPFLLRNEDIQIVKQFRKLNNQDKQKRFQQGRLMEYQTRNKFKKLLTQIPLKPHIEQWTYIYNQSVQKFKFEQQKPRFIEECTELKQAKVSYFQRYKAWKLKEYQSMYLQFRLYTIKKGSIICKKCWPNNLTLIEDLQAFCTEKKILKLNQYRGSWTQDKNRLYCTKKHEIGHIINSDQGFIQFQNIFMYAPMGRVTKFDGQKQSIQQMLSTVEQGIEQMQAKKRKLCQFQCKVCSQCDDYDKLKRIVIDRQGLEFNVFWKKITDHMYSKKHLDNLQRFLIDI